MQALLSYTVIIVVYTAPLRISGDLSDACRRDNSNTPGGTTPSSSISFFQVQNTGLDKKEEQQDKIHNNNNNNNKKKRAASITK